MKNLSKCLRYEDCFETLREARAEIKRLMDSRGCISKEDVGFKAALHKIAAIKLNATGGDYDEINEAKAIAGEALGIHIQP